MQKEALVCSGEVLKATLTNIKRNGWKCNSRTGEVKEDLEGCSKGLLQQHSEGFRIVDREKIQMN